MTGNEILELAKTVQAALFIPAGGNSILRGSLQQAEVEVIAHALRRVAETTEKNTLLAVKEAYSQGYADASNGVLPELKPCPKCAHTKENCENCRNEHKGYIYADDDKRGEDACQNCSRAHKDQWRAK